MSNDTVVSLAAPARVCDPLTALLRTGVRRLIEAAVSAEFEEYLSAFVQEKLPDGQQRVVRNGQGLGQRARVAIVRMVCVGTGAHHGAASRRRCRPGASVRVYARLTAALGHPPRPIVFITGKLPINGPLSEVGR